MENQETWESWGISKRSRDVLTGTKGHVGELEDLRETQKTLERAEGLVGKLKDLKKTQKNFEKGRGTCRRT